MLNNAIMKLKKFIQKHSAELKTIFYGMVYIFIAIFIWWHIARNPFEELDLILNAKVVEGFIIDSWEEINEHDDGSSNWTHSYLYEYQTPNGHKFRGVNEGSGRITIDLEKPYPVEVEYLQDNPEVSRIKGGGSTSILEWLFKRMGVGGLLLIIAISPGFILVRHEIIKIQKNIKDK